MGFWLAQAYSTCLIPVSTAALAALRRGSGSGGRWSTPASCTAVRRGHPLIFVLAAMIAPPKKKELPSTWQ